MSGAPAGTDAPSKPASPPRELSPEETVLLKLQAELKQRGEHKLTAYLNRSCVYSVDGDVVTLAFHPFAVDFHKSKVEEQLDVVTAALSEVLGRAVSVRCTAFEGATTASNGLVAEAERMGAKVVSPRSE